MQIICVASQKGGAGKTTIAMVLADVLHRRDYRTLVVDVDPQRSAQKWEQRVLDDFPPYPVRVEAASGLETAEFAKWLTKRQDYDIVVVDTPPALNSKELRTGLFAADLTLIPLVAHNMFLDAVEEIATLIKGVETMRGEPMLVRTLRNRMQNRTSSERGLGDLIERSSAWPMLNTRMKENVAFADAGNYRTSFYAMRPRRDIREMAESFGDEVLQLLKLNTEARRG